MGQAAIGQLPNRQWMHCVILCKRNVANRVPEIPRFIEDLEFSEEFKVHKPTPETEETFCI
ncbi:hypothetical protein SK128_023276, partial [Halocaridina rubra]